MCCLLISWYRMSFSLKEIKTLVCFSILFMVSSRWRLHRRHGRRWHLCTHLSRHLAIILLVPEGFRHVSSLMEKKPKSFSPETWFVGRFDEISGPKFGWKLQMLNLQRKHPENSHGTQKLKAFVHFKHRWFSASMIFLQGVVLGRGSSLQMCWSKPAARAAFRFQSPASDNYMNDIYTP